MKSQPDGVEPSLVKLLERPEPLSPDAAVTVASARLRSSGLPALPVVDSERLLGVVSERAVLFALAGTSRSDGTCKDLVEPATVIPLTTLVEDTLWLLRRPEIELLVVSGAAGEYLGVLSRRRLTEGLEDARRPRLVGGLATPLGVHLTSVNHRGGVSDLCLLVSGLYVMVLWQIARGVVAFGMALTSRDPMLAALRELAPALTQLGAAPAAGLVSYLAMLLVFLMLLRLSALAGYHSGEHQAVHALERGLPLVYEQVVQMPRPHPRCGTNLATLLTLVMLVVSLLSARAPWVVLLPAVVALFLWRRIGHLVQEWFTTKPASRRQVEAGIQAARMLLSRYQRQPAYRAKLWIRIWNRGLLQVLAGMLLGYVLGLPLRAAAAWLAWRV
ncbi:MAG: DUF1385 domain-containing protein [Armatimonadetes bacterium]|nr:DUF1385 domain-containing protein [Armatimonadota bacterium]